MKIVTILPILWHLDIKYYWKDIIQIWNTFIENKKFESEFWTLSKTKNSFNYKWQKRLWFKNYFLLLIYLIWESNKIDLLHLYWIKRDTLIIMFIYKILNWKWKIYVKTDMPLYKNWIDSREVLNKLPWFLLLFFVSLVDFLWLENKELVEYFKNKYKNKINKFLFLPSWAINIKKYIWIKNKEKEISLCWRFWAKEKNFELIIEMLKNNDVNLLKWWKINLIWETTKEFDEKISNIILEKPILKDIISVKGFKNEKNELYEIIIKSKLFIITSNSEWEPNVQFDSMFCWNYIISTDVWTIKQNYPKKYSLFYEINNSEDLYKKIKKFIIEIDEKINISDYQKIQDHCIENFIWEKSLTPILNKF